MAPIKTTTSAGAQVYSHATNGAYLETGYETSASTFSTSTTNLSKTQIDLSNFFTVKKKKGARHTKPKKRR
jgi:hypothetical protein